MAPGSFNPCRLCGLLAVSITSTIYSVYWHTTSSFSSAALGLGREDHMSLPTNPTSGGLRTVKSHMLSLEPLRYSLHPEWKLWIEMSEEEQETALTKVGAYLTKYGGMISPPHKEKGKIKHGECKFEEFKNGHALCGPRPATKDNCTFFSFGINDDPSFDVQLGEEWGCRGFAGDPTVQHPSKLHPRVTFHSVGASMLSDNEERKINKGGEEEW